MRLAGLLQRRYGPPRTMRAGAASPRRSRSRNVSPSPASKRYRGRCMVHPSALAPRSGRPEPEPAERWIWPAKGGPGTPLYGGAVVLSRRPEQTDSMDSAGHGDESSASLSCVPAVRAGAIGNACLQVWTRAGTKKNKGKKCRTVLIGNIHMSTHSKKVSHWS